MRETIDFRKVRKNSFDDKTANSLSHSNMSDPYMNDEWGGLDMKSWRVKQDACVDKKKKDAEMSEYEELEELLHKNPTIAPFAANNKFENLDLNIF